VRVIKVYLLTVKYILQDNNNILKAFSRSLMQQKQKKSDVSASTTTLHFMNL